MTHTSLALATLIHSILQLFSTKAAVRNKLRVMEITLMEVLTAKTIIP